jgi:hypothetical protein
MSETNILTWREHNVDDKVKKAMLRQVFSKQKTGRGGSLGKIKRLKQSATDEACKW